jgi:hypothetical protein
MPIDDEDYKRIEERCVEEVMSLSGDSFMNQVQRLAMESAIRFACRTGFVGGIERGIAMLSGISKAVNL